MLQRSALPTSLPPTLLLTLLALGSAFLPSLAHAQVAADDAAIDRLIALTALGNELAYDLAQSRRFVAADCAARSGCRAYEPEVAAALNEAQTDLRLGPLVRPQVLELLETMGDIERSELFAFYESPFGRRIVELETAGRSPESLDEIATRGEEIYQRQSDERIALFEAIDSMSDASASVRVNARSALRIAEYLERRADEAGRPHRPATEPDIDERSRHRFHQRLALTYEPLADEDLEQYVEFLEGSAGESWAAARREIRQRVVSADGERLLDAILGRID
ncbi:MAG: hypothetical protein AAGC60_22835 [Acidobacteriota bacterium]